MPFVAIRSQPDEVKNKKDYGNTEAQGKATFCLGTSAQHSICVPFFVIRPPNAFLCPTHSYFCSIEKPNNGISGNQTLRHINLNANPLGDAALLVFAEALQQMDANAAAVGGGSGGSGFAILSLIACAGLSADGVREARERFPNACARKIQIDRVLASTDAPAPVHAYFAALQGRAAAV